ncbi:MAG: flagellar export chaperone FlgN [Fervidobacterium sp.]|uniref:flagellar export chaperone FlgN n=1 Tax=Fervidobacterium sp. TaxID=1871331 RepID=UPI00404AD399
MNTLKENLKSEIRALESMVQAFRGLESAVLNKKMDMLSKYSVSIEELSLEISLLESQRDEFLKKLGYSTLAEYIEKDNSDEKREISLMTAEIVEKLNELSIVMNAIRQIMEFNEHYFELLNHLVRGTSTQPTYSASGYGKSGTFQSPTYDSKYDRFK